MLGRRGRASMPGSWGLAAIGKKKACCSPPHGGLEFFSWEKFRHWRGRVAHPECQLEFSFRRCAKREREQPLDRTRLQLDVVRHPALESPRLFLLGAEDEIVDARLVDVEGPEIVVAEIFGDLSRNFRLERFEGLDVLGIQALAR